MQRIYVAIVLLSFILTGHQAFSTHTAGGEIYWDCINEQSIVVHVLIYKDCSVFQLIDPNGNFIRFNNHNSLYEVPLNLTDVVDLNDQNCGALCDQSVGRELYRFQTDTLQLGGLPPVEGWEISYNLCCRATTHNLLNPTTNTLTLSARMYALSEATTGACLSSSPRALLPPPGKLCSGSLLSYNSMSTDPEGDSISYEFKSALALSFPDHIELSYLPGYSFDSPLPGPAIDPSYSSATIDPGTGQLEYALPEGLEGKWNITMGISEWRCGELASTTTRDFIVEAENCAIANQPPEFLDPEWSFPPSTNGWNVTINAGDSVNFTLECSDPDINQTISMEIDGQGFGSDMTSAFSDCQNTPCPFISGNLPILNTDSASINFRWNTSCDHVLESNDCASNSTTYRFYFKATDNQCPVAEQTTKVVSITIVDPALLSSPIVHCADVLPDGSVELTWEPSEGNSLFFQGYKIQHRSDQSQPFQQIAETSNFNATNYLHSLVGSNPPSISSFNQYKVRVQGGCGGSRLAAPHRIVNSLFLSLSDIDHNAVLNWNHQATWHLQTSNGPGLYEVQKEYPNGVYHEIGFTQNSSFSEMITWPAALVKYRLQLSDSYPCVSTSNIASDILDDSPIREMDPIHVFPNPTKGVLSVRTTAIGIGAISLHSLMGGLVLEKEFFNGAIDLDVSHLPGGLYMIHVKSSQGFIRRRISIL